MAKRKPIAKKKPAKSAQRSAHSKAKSVSPTKSKTIRSKTIKVKKKSAVIFSTQKNFWSWVELLPVEKLSAFASSSTEKASKLLSKSVSAAQRSSKIVVTQTRQSATQFSQTVTQFAGTTRSQQQKISQQIHEQTKTLKRKRAQLSQKMSASLNAVQVQTQKFSKTLALTLARKPLSSKAKKQKVTSTKNKKKKILRAKTPQKKQSPSKIGAFFSSIFTPIGHFFRVEIFGSFIYIFRHHLLLTVFCLLMSGAILFGAYEVYDIGFKDLPQVTELTQRKQALTTKILDRNGKVLYNIYKDENRTLVPLSALPQNMINATVSIEDRSFFSNQGISFRGIFRALLSDVQGDELQGGSTITQQLVKNTLLTPERTFKRKVREIILSILVEQTYTKQQILEMYFNEVGYGGDTYGVEEAAEKYFGKPVTQLDLAECAMLAGLPQSPTTYSPFGANPELANNRQHQVLQSMVTDKYITQAQADAAKNETLHFNEDATSIQAPHFVMYVKSLLEQQYGEDVVNQGGLIVRTTLDLDTQNQAQKIVTDEVGKLAPLRISNGAALVTNPATGEILAMIGSKDYFDFAHDGQVNVTMRPRQPGSSIKPLTYSLALTKGETPSTTILDEPTTFVMAGTAPYSPRNYDGKFHGLVTLRTALASSFNIPAVKTLAFVGLNNMIDKGQEMGITTWTDRSRFGLSLTLGSGEVLMVDMAKMYSTFANYGDTVSLNPILDVKDSQGNVLYQNECALRNTDCPKTHNLDPKVAYEITDILSDNAARTPAFGPNSVLNIPNQQVAVKTGTTNNLKDNWAIGYTRNRMVLTWVGNNDGTPMSYVASGVTGASPIWNDIMRTQLSDATPSAFPMPDGFTKVQVCATTGTLPCQGCPVVDEELFGPGQAPTQACNPAQFAPPPSPVPSVTVAPQNQVQQSGNFQNRNTQTRDRILNGVSVSQ